MTQLYCPDEERLATLRADAAPPVNAIDHVVVLPSRRALAVHCLSQVAGIDKRHVKIDGGVRLEARVEDVRAASDPSAEAFLANPADWAQVPADGDARARVLLVRTTNAGDYSLYTVAIEQPGATPPWDPVLAQATFSFKVDCPSDFDCRPDTRCPPPERTSPRIDYLAKDYASFRRLMLDRAAEIAPGWAERNPVDLGMALVETIAYAADQLSYQQDAAATEAYLGTARLRPSVRRHGRLVDYRLGEGQAARTWLAFEGDGFVPGGTRAFSERVTLRTSSDPADDGPLDDAVRTGAVVFETLHDLSSRGVRDRIVVHNWGDDRCCLPRGATSATLRGRPTTVGLSPGDVLILEVVDADGPPLSNDPRRHAVRLKAVGPEVRDRVVGAYVFDVEWYEEDALPFALDVGPREDRRLVARGNVALAEHGFTVREEGLRIPERPGDRPQLERLGLTHALPYDDDDARLASARAARAERPQDATPAATVHMAGGDVWRPEPDLLRTGPFGQRFVVEMHTDGRAQLRFGDDTNGRQPQRATVFDVVFRIGNGPSGNVGADSLDRLHPPFEPTVALSGALVVRNPLPATGGAAPETLTQARLAAPVAFRRQERAVTASDYAEAAMRLPEVQKAAATRRWTGSWFTFFVTVDRRGGLPVDAPFEAKLRDYFDAVRLAGYDVEIDGPKPAAIDLELEICVQSGLRRETVAAKLREELSSRVLVDGRRGFFHPDELSFGQPVYLSRIVARAMAVEGVQSVQPKRFQRWRESDHGERAAGVLTVGRLEIARLDDDPNRPENGRLTLSMRGGL